jgi:hypothetical protein
MPFMAALSLTITTQVLGFGWAGLLRKYLVVYTYALSLSLSLSHTHTHTHKSSLLPHFFATLNLCFSFFASIVPKNIEKAMTRIIKTHGLLLNVEQTKVTI